MSSILGRKGQPCESVRETVQLLGGLAPVPSTGREGATEGKLEDLGRGDLPVLFSPHTRFRTVSGSGAERAVLARTGRKRNGRSKVAAALA